MLYHYVHNIIRQSINWSVIYRNLGILAKAFLNCRYEVIFKCTSHT